MGPISTPGWAGVAWVISLAPHGDLWECIPQAQVPGGPRFPWALRRLGGTQGISLFRHSHLKPRTWALQYRDPYLWWLTLST